MNISIEKTPDLSYNKYIVRNIKNDRKGDFI